MRAPLHRLRSLFLATAVVTGIVVAGCGGDDDDNATNTTPDGGDNPTPDDGGQAGPDGGADAPVNNADTFPAYVKSLIDTKTADDTQPEAESAWGAIPDDDTAATAGALFPPAYFQ